MTRRPNKSEGSSAVCSAYRVLCTVLVVPLVSCGLPSEESLQREIRDLRRQRTDLIDAMYEEYGGGSLVPETDDPTTDSAAPRVVLEVLDAVRGAVTEGDRALFEVHLRTVGEGERPKALTSKARDYFADSRVKKRARRIVDLKDKIDSLEVQLDGVRDRRE